MSSNTPRTDAEQWTIPDFPPEIADVVYAAFARQLERDLAAANAEKDGLFQLIKENEASLLAERNNYEMILSASFAAGWDECESRRKEAESVLAECEALRKDAERYRWLRYRTTSLEGEMVLCYSGVKLDAAIDAAIAARKEST